MRLLALVALISFAAFANDLVITVQAQKDILASELQKLDETPEGKAWAQVWKSKDPLSALKGFQKKYGLPLVTTEQVGRIVLPALEAPCTGTYLSLVKDSRKLAHAYRDVVNNGHVIYTWNAGSEEILAIYENALYRKVSFYETLSDYSMMKPRSAPPKAHEYVLVISNDKTLQLLPPNSPEVKTWTPQDSACPEKFKAEDVHCVKSKGRTYVLPNACS